MAEQDLARQWLRENGYADIADLVETFIAKWKAAGKKTRRNWWEILAGGNFGKPRTVDGQPFPVLKAAQIRQGLPVTANAISRSEEKSLPPGQRVTKRWLKRRKKVSSRASKARGRHAKRRSHVGHNWRTSA
jgi:hypothetical protein